MLYGFNADGVRGRYHPLIGSYSWRFLNRLASRPHAHESESTRLDEKVLYHLIDNYGRLEQAVRGLTERLCRPTCSACSAVCCRIDYCKETLESAFLSRVADRFSSGTRFDPARGWLSASGCTLPAGRPPVCYEFLCAPILEAYSNASSERRHALAALSMLMTHAGRQVAGSRHLVEIIDADRLNRIRADRFRSRLRESREAFEAVAAVMQARASDDHRQALARIVPYRFTEPQRIRSMDGHRPRRQT